MKQAHAGTLESMDCMVFVAEGTPGSGVSINIEGSGAVRFRSSIEETVKKQLKLLNVQDLEVRITDHGALDLVMAARVETAVKRLREAE